MKKNIVIILTAVLSSLVYGESFSFSNSWSFTSAPKITSSHSYSTSVSNRNDLSCSYKYSCSTKLNRMDVDFDFNYDTQSFARVYSTIIPSTVNNIKLHLNYEDVEILTDESTSIRIEILKSAKYENKYPFVQYSNDYISIASDQEKNETDEYCLVKISLPKNYNTRALSISTKSGLICISGFTAQFCNIASVSGDIITACVSSESQYLYSTSGSINNLCCNTGFLNNTTISGNIITRDLQADNIESMSTSGNIDTTTLSVFTVVCNTVSGNIKLKSEERYISSCFIESVSGDIEVKTAKNQEKGVFEISSTSGSVTIN